MMARMMRKFVAMQMPTVAVEIDLCCMQPFRHGVATSAVSEHGASPKPKALPLLHALLVSLWCGLSVSECSASAEGIAPWSFGLFVVGLTVHLPKACLMITKHVL